MPPPPALLSTPLPPIGRPIAPRPLNGQPAYDADQRARNEAERAGLELVPGDHAADGDEAEQQRNHVAGGHPRGHAGHKAQQRHKQRGQ
jgi:hypothetical protein